MHERLFLVLLLLAAACRPVPSSVPLGDSGRHDYAGLADLVDRRPREDTADLDLDDADEIEVTASAPRASASSGSLPPVTPGASHAPTDDATWPGEYYGSDRFTWQGFDGRESVEVDDKAHTRVESSSDGEIVITIVNSQTGESICALHATTTGSEATIREDETCFGSAELAATVTEGHASVNGDRLTLDFKAHLDQGLDLDGDDDEGDDDDDDTVTTSRAAGSYHFDGQRQ